MDDPDELIPQERDHQSEDRSDHCKQADASTDHCSAFPSAAFSDSLPEKNRSAHRKTGHEIRDCHHHLGAGRNRRHI